DVTCDSCAFENAVYVLSGNERVFRLEVTGPINGIALDEFDIAGASIYHQPRPIIVCQQEASIGLDIILDSEFYEQISRDWNISNKILEDSILAPLRKYPKFSFIWIRI